MAFESLSIVISRKELPASIRCQTGGGHPMSQTVRLSLCALLVAVAGAQTPVLRKGVSVQMPVTANAVTMPGADLADSLIVAVSFRGGVFLGATPVTPAQLSEKVKADLEGRADKKVYLKGDAGTPYRTVAEVLGALRTAGVGAPILLTNQHDSADTSYAPPAGLEVLLPPPAPDAAQSTTLRVGSGQPADAELKQRAQRDWPVVLQVDEAVPFGEVAHIVDVYRKAGAKVYLDTAGR
jgi:biopolymer transport protein ExbD